jgi:hypothetical protein
MFEPGIVRLGVNASLISYTFPPVFISGAHLLEVSIVPLMKRTNFVLLKKAKLIDIERSSPKSIHNHSVYMVGSLNPRPSGDTATSRSRR